MLVIVMHNNQDYLESLRQLARRNAVTETAIVNKKHSGFQLVGGEAGFLLSRGTKLDTYDRFFVAALKSEEKAKDFLQAIEQDTYLDMLNIEDKGFICSLPFNRIKNLEPELTLERREEVKMKIGDYLKEERILLDLKAVNKEDAIKEVAGLLQGAGEIINHEQFLNDVFSREALSSTGIGNHVAIPHTRTDAVREFVIAFGRSSQGLDFKSVDGRPAKFIFVLGTLRKKGLNSYLKTLAHLTRLLQKEAFQKALLEASAPKEIIEAFRKIEH
jgi:fructose-specific phosphotransferase system IIA component